MCDGEFVLCWRGFLAVTVTATADQDPTGSEHLYNAILQELLFDRGRQEVLVAAAS